MFEVDQKGIRIIGTSLWLDPNRKVPCGFISHAHADHIRKHERIIATPQTISFLQHRCGKIGAHPLNFNQPYQIEGVTIELFPAGHILGSAQILIIKDGLRLVYTGDFNPRKSLTAERMGVREADILILESTFGLPKYRFPQRWHVIEQLINKVDKCFSRGVVPVILAYSLGKSQEVIKILGDLNYQMSVHPSIYQLNRIYERHGISLKNWNLFEGEPLHNRVVLIPPHVRNWLEKRYKGKVAKIVVTGWAVDDDVKYRYNADEAIPLSDHADFNDLISYVKRVSPKTVYVTHGFKEFSKYLANEGFDACPLNRTSQLSLF